MSATDTYNETRDRISTSRERRLAELVAAIRAIELAVDGLNTKAFTQKPETQKTLDYIKSRCRDALSR